MKASIEYILRHKPIVSYLESKGHSPVKTLTDGKLSYLCPLPGHNESRPSFMVYTNSSYQNFYCFGCQRGTNIIHMISFMENMTFSDALKKLAGELEVSFIDEGVLTDEIIGQEFCNNQIHPICADISEIILSISSMCRAYLNGVNHDAEEIALLDKFWFVIDKDLSEYEHDKIRNTLSNLPTILDMRQKKYNDKILEQKRCKLQNL